MHDPPMHDAATSKPAEGLAVRIWLANGSSMKAIWTGEHWRVRDGHFEAVDAVRWQEIPATHGDEEQKTP